MKFEYNKDLLFEERVRLVTKEILSEYPLISAQSAKEAASLATPIDDKVLPEDKLDRYYFIMKIIGNKHDEFSHVFNDAFEVYQNGIRDDKYNTLMENIIKYMKGEMEVFPEI